MKTYSWFVNTHMPITNVKWERVRMLLQVACILEINIKFI